MFGYLTPYKEGLSEKDRETYQAYYCGLCRELKHRFGMKSQLILAYDLVFLALLRNGLYEEDTAREKGFCFWKHTQVFRESDPCLAYAADMNLLLSYNNYIDQAHDSASKKAQTAVKLLKKDYEAVSARYPRQKEAVETYMKKLSAWEKDPGDNPDEAANYTGEMLREVFLEREDEYASYLRPMFYYLGKYIYLCDAYTDVFDDLASGSYNPYAALADTEGFDDLVQRHLESVMGECCRYFEMLPLFRHRDILRNILYAGVWIAYSGSRNQRTKEGKES
ncbi:MAG: hypothetical protein IJL98_02065 [Lachnospiraceae bacterium]|nr:hypothetical protein [Lachnospiraceae bacterium]